MRPISLAQYALELYWHDWLYGFSDDYCKWYAGSQKNAELYAYRSQSQDHSRLYHKAYTRVMKATGLM